MTVLPETLESRPANDPSSSWVLDPSRALDFDLESRTLAGVGLGDPADRLAFLGPAEDPLAAAEGRLYYYTSGMEVQVENDRVILFRFVWRDELGEGFNPFPGRIFHAPTGMEIGRDSSELALRRACGVPFLRTRDAEGVCVFYETEDAGWDAEFTLRGDMKQLTLYSPPLSEDEKKLLDPETAGEVEEPPPPEPERTFRQELFHCLVWPFSPFVVIVLAVVLSLATEGLRSVYRLTQHGIQTQATAIREEQAPTQDRRAARALIYSYTDQQGRPLVHRMDERTARWLNARPGDRFTVTYDRRNPGFHLRYAVTRASLVTAARNTLLFLALILAPAVTATVGAAAYIVWRRRHPPEPKPAPKKPTDALGIPMAPPPRRPRRDSIRLILQAYGLLCLLLIGQLAWTGLNESRAYERLYSERGAPARATIVRSVLSDASPGAEVYTITYSYEDNKGGLHVSSTRVRRSEGRWVIAYSQITNPPFGRRWTEWLVGPEPKVGNEVIVSYSQDDPESHLPFLLSEDILARPIMGAVRMSFTTVGALTCFAGCFLGLGYLVLLRR